MDILTVLTQALENASKAKNLKPGSDAYASALRWELYASLQNVLDGLAMVLADLRLRKPGTYSELGSVLREQGIFTSEEEQHIKVIATARNTLARAYRRLQVGDLLSIEREILPIAETISKKLIDYTDKTGLDPEPLGVEDLRVKLEPVFKKHGVLLAYLLGSRARGTAKRKSDYDFAVLLEKDVDIMGEIRLSLEIAKALNIPPDMVDVSTLNKTDTSLKYRLFKEGKPVYWSSEKLKNRWERTTYLQLLELKELHNVYLRKIKASLGITGKSLETSPKEPIKTSRS